LSGSVASKEQNVFLVAYFIRC